MLWHPCDFVHERFSSAQRAMNVDFCGKIMLEGDSDTGKVKRNVSMIHKTAENDELQVLL